jgi:hypothetical protein
MIAWHMLLQRWGSMAKSRDYSKPINVVDKIAGTTWSAKYIGRHPTKPGWHRIMSDGSVKDVDPDGYFQGQRAELMVRNGED